MATKDEILHFDFIIIRKFSRAKYRQTDKLEITLAACVIKRISLQINNLRVIGLIKTGSSEKWEIKTPDKYLERCKLILQQDFFYFKSTDCLNVPPTAGEQKRDSADLLVTVLQSRVLESSLASPTEMSHTCPPRFREFLPSAGTGTRDKGCAGCGSGNYPQWPPLGAVGQHETFRRTGWVCRECRFKTLLSGKQIQNGMCSAMPLLS